MTIAGAFPLRSTELHRLGLLRMSQRFPKLASFPRSSHCEDEFSSKTCVLLASETALESEVREALRIRYNTDTEQTTRTHCAVYATTRNRVTLSFIRHATLKHEHGT